MAEERPFLTLTLDLSDPVEAHDFASLFGSLAGRFENYVQENYPDAPRDAKIYVKEVRKGSIIADLFPGGPSDIIAYMDSALIVCGFAALIGNILKGYAVGSRHAEAKKSDLRDYLGTVRALANNTSGTATLETAVYEENILTRRVAFRMSTDEAKKAVQEIEHHKADLDRRDAADHERVLMVFKRPDIGDVATGKRSGERVVIENISGKDRPLIYASELAEQRIKHELRESETNVFKLGFVVDVNVQLVGGKPSAYAITNVHQIIDLPDD